MACAMLTTDTRRYRTPHDKRDRHICVTDTTDLYTRSTYTTVFNNGAGAHTVVSIWMWLPYRWLVMGMLLAILVDSTIPMASFHNSESVTAVISTVVVTPPDDDDDDAADCRTGADRSLTAALRAARARLWV